MKYVITGINTLTGQREQISGAMEKEDAQERLKREIENRLGRSTRHTSG